MRLVLGERTRPARAGAARQSTFCPVQPAASGRTRRQKAFREPGHREWETSTHKQLILTLAGTSRRQPAAVRHGEPQPSWSRQLPSKSRSLALTQRQLHGNERVLVGAIFKSVYFGIWLTVSFPLQRRFDRITCEGNRKKGTQGY